MPELVRFSHIDLTVTDGERSARWLREVLGFALMHHRKDPEQQIEAWSLMSPRWLSINLLVHPEAATEPFDERRVGLDHLSFEVRDRAELEAWVTHLDAVGVEHSGIIDAQFGATLVFRDPDNIQFEMMVSPDAAEAASMIATDPGAL
jgi:catechol 2,3-dioxygenase-like lactoylglutathione lyase family enzyme